MGTLENTLQDFKVDERVTLHPATDLWMRGARYGTVAKIGRTAITVDLDLLGRVRVAPRNLCHV
jgi:hypothetical protein